MRYIISYRTLLWNFFVMLLNSVSSAIFKLRNGQYPLIHHRLFDSIFLFLNSNDDLMSREWVLQLKHITILSRQGSIMSRKEVITKSKEKIEWHLSGHILFTHPSFLYILKQNAEHECTYRNLQNIKPYIFSVKIVR